MTIAGHHCTPRIEGVRGRFEKPFKSSRCILGYMYNDVRNNEYYKLIDSNWNYKIFYHPDLTEVKAFFW